MRLQIVPVHVALLENLALINVQRKVRIFLGPLLNESVVSRLLVYHFNYNRASLSKLIDNIDQGVYFLVKLGIGSH